jgi:hypothetical protein
MTASPPWAPHEAPAGPTYPLTDADVLSEPVPVERFGPPPQSKPTFFEKLRDRIAVRRALSRSSSSYDDAVQIVSGSGALAHTGRARLEVERRRQETLRMDPGAVPGDKPGADRDDKVDDLGPVPPTTQMVPPRGATRAPGLPGQMPLPGTASGMTSDTGKDNEGHDTFERPVLGVPTPPRIPPPPPIPPAKPDPLGQALSDFDRERVAGTPLSAEPRPWRPREFPEDLPSTETPSHRDRPAAAATAAAATSTPSRRHSPSQVRESRRLLALFGGATLVMLVVGIVSGRTSTPLPTATSTQPQSSAAPAQHPAPAQPSARASTAPVAPANPAPQASAKPPAAAPASTAPTLTGTKVLGDSGTGYQVSNFRYGPHPGYFRVVMDFGASGAAAGTPKATIGFLDSTTLIVAVDGVIPAGSTGALPANGTVSSVTLLNPSPFPNATTYQIKLAHPVSLAASYLGGPLRLVIDLGG